MHNSTDSQILATLVLLWGTQLLLVVDIFSFLPLILELFEIAHKESFIRSSILELNMSMFFLLRCKRTLSRIVILDFIGELLVEIKPGQQLASSSWILQE